MILYITLQFHIKFANTIVVAELLIDIILGIAIVF
jgi:preprotein translocase subunit SecF